MRFRWFGTEIYVSFLFAAVLAALLICDRTGLLLPTLIAVTVHESGHLVAMRLAGCAPKSIRLVPASVQITRPFCPKPQAEIGIALAGPGANLCAALSCWMLHCQSGRPLWLVNTLLHLLIGAFNLLPVAGLDGGTVLREGLQRRCSPKTACRIMRGVTAVTVALLIAGGIGLWRQNRGNYSLFAVALYLAVTAAAKR